MALAVLVTALLLCVWQPQHAEARMMARAPAAAAVEPQAQQAAAVPDRSAAPATAAAPLARSKETAVSRLQPKAAAPAPTPAAVAAVAVAAGQPAAAQKRKPATAPAVSAFAAAAAKKPAAAAAAVASLPESGAASSSSSSSKAAAAQSSNAHIVEGLPETIPIPLLLGEAKFSNPQLSTDGRYLAYVKPTPGTGVANVFVRKLPDAGSAPPAAASPSSSNSSSSSEAAASPASPGDREISIFELEGTDSDLQVTFDTRQGVDAFSWAEDSSSIFFIQDSNGDENYHLFLAPVVPRPGPAVDLTPFPGVKAKGIVSNELFPNKLFISLNRRDPSVFDMYELDIPTLQLTLHTVNPGDTSNWLMDYSFDIRGAECYNNSNGASYVLINDALPTPITNESMAAAKRRADEAAKQAASAAAAAAGSSAPQQERLQADVTALEALFARADKEGWGVKEWVAASSSKADVSTWRRLITWPFGEEGGVFKFNKAGDGLFVISSVGRDTTELQLISTAPGAKVLRHIASNPLANINSVDFDTVSWEPQIVSFDYLKVQWTLLDPVLKWDWARLEAMRPDEEVIISDRSLDGKVWLVGYTSDSVSSKYYLHRPGTWPPQLLLDTQPDLLNYTITKTHPVVIEARDGLVLPSYLSLPVKPGIPPTLPSCVAGPVPDLSGAHQGRFDVAVQRRDVSSAEASRLPLSSGASDEASSASSASACPVGLNLPLVLYVHGGPWSRDTWGADPVVQLLANRGYAVLQVNYRASSGYGKRFMNLGDKQWGVGTMQHDLSDAVKWAVDKGVADPSRVCIMGGSYGGYATLAGLAFTPELYACGVDLVGISNVATFQDSIPPWWRSLNFEWQTRVGPANTNETFNRRISPMFHVEAITAPLLIAQGAHDPRVPQAESDQMFRAMHTRGREVEYVLYTDEGHGVDRPDNRIDYYRRVELFLAQHLGGRTGPPPTGLKDVAAVEVKTLQDLARVAPAAVKKEKGSSKAAAAVKVASIKSG